MKLAILKNDEGFVELFRRLIETNAEEIVIFDPCSNPAKSDTDVYFYFPCSNSQHRDCGFFVWVISINTASSLYSDIEKLRVDKNLEESKVLAITDENFHAFNIIVQESFTNSETLNLIRKWLIEWVQEIAELPIRMADVLEYQRKFAVYEEFHLNGESLDIFFHEQRGLITNEFYFKGKMLSKNEYDEAIKDIIRKRLGEDNA